MNSKHNFGVNKSCILCGLNQVTADLFESTHCRDIGHGEAMRQATMQRQHSPPKRDFIKPGETPVADKAAEIARREAELNPHVNTDFRGPDKPGMEMTHALAAELIDEILDKKKLAASLGVPEIDMQKPEGRVGYINLRAETLRQFLDLPHGVEITNATWDYRRNSVVVSLRGDDLPEKCARRHPDEHITEVFPKYREAVCYVYGNKMDFSIMQQKSRTTFDGFQ